MRLKTPAHKYYGSEGAVSSAKKYSYKRRTYPYAGGSLSQVDGKIYLDNPDQIGARWMKQAHEIVRLNHTGWYCDDFYDNLCRGLVIDLSRHNKPLFLAGYEFTQADGLTFDTYVYDDEKEAARAADGMAEYAAELEREFQEKERQEQKVEDLKAEIVEEKAALRALLHEYNRLKRRVAIEAPVICATIRRDIRRLINGIRTTQDKLEALE